MTATVLVVPVPEADPVIGELRAQHTPGGQRGMPSHITVLAPFVDADALDDAALHRLNSAVSKIGAFDFALTRTAQFDTGVLYLAVEPLALFRELMARVCDTFPGYHPYGGEFSTENVVPHCTVAVGESFPNGLSDTDGVLFARIESEIAVSLPVTSRAVGVEVLADMADGSTSLAQLSLGG